MTEIILTDRVTLEPIAISIASGIVCMNASTETPVADPVIADQKQSTNWVLFVADGIIGHEETSQVSGRYVEIDDSDTGIGWRFQVVGGVLAYVHFFDISTILNSRIKQDQDLVSEFNDQGMVDSGVFDVAGMNSEIDQDRSANSRVSSAITLKSKVG